MYNSDTHTLSGPPEELSRVLRCSVAELHAALTDLQHHNAARVLVRNGCVTLTSRRLERLQKRRVSGALRNTRYRKKRPRDAASASAYASASDLLGKEGVGEREVEPPPLPPGFPVTVDDALRQCEMVAVPKEFVMQAWNKAHGRGGLDAKGIAIRNFASVVLWEFGMERGRQAEQASKAKSGHARPGAPAYFPDNTVGAEIDKLTSKIMSDIKKGKM